MKRGSDLHLRASRPLTLRVNGLIHTVPEIIFSADEIRDLVFSIMSNVQVQKFEREKELDFSYDLEEKARFRINLFYHGGTMGVVLRHIPLKIPTIEELNLPLVLKELALKESGLILCTGPTGSGKSTTLASMVEHINKNKSVHIITIEDPIEFIFKDKKSVITQREVGIDTLSFAKALKHVLRQDPDVILVGEMRDLETISTAITAAETGHLVMSTLHTIDAKQTIDRILDQFPASQQRLVQRQLSQILVAVLSQQLVRTIDETGRVPVVEIMINSPTIKALIAEGKIEEITPVMEESKRYYKMQSFNQALIELCERRKIDVATALTLSNRPDDLKLKLAGLEAGGDLLPPLLKEKKEGNAHQPDDFIRFSQR
jgi:twitching motility protein PilT